MVARPEPKPPIDGLPTVVIVGRPNVGKSTLFNVILGQRRSIVGDEPGITRDRIHGQAVYRGRRFELIDTGGIIQNDAEWIPTEILKQARVALGRAAQIIFLIDGRTEITGADRELAKMLRQLDKPVTLAVNKIDTQARESLAHEFHSLGFRDLFPISAEHHMGIGDLLDHVTEGFETSVEPPKDQESPAAEEGAEAPAAAPRAIKVAIVGRPNVGKSTLLNALVGEERSIVSSIAGTTRDAVDESVVHDGVEFVFMDTAGIRRKGKTKLMAEKLSVVMARRHIRMANVVILVLDASEGVLGHDATVAGYAHEEGRALILCVNKWDLAGEKSRRVFTQSIRDELKFLEYAPIAFVSAKKGTGVKQLFGLIRDAYKSASKRVGTGELNRFVELLDFDRDIKVYYMTQTSVRPPTFVVFTDKAKELHFSTERFLINQLRKRFGFESTPIVIKTKRR
jgi:GTP-binding protein